MPALPTGLVCHPDSGTYYLRRRIPTDLLPCYPGKREFSRSLRTKNYRAALELHRLAEAELTSEWQAHRQRLAETDAQQRIQAVMQIKSLTPEAIADICAHFEAASLEGEERRRMGDDPYSDEEIEEHQAGYQAAIDCSKRALARGQLDVFRGALDQFLDLYGYQVDAPEEDMRRLTRAFAHVAVQTNQKLLQRYDGEDVPTPAFAHKVASPLLSSVLKDYVEYYEKLEKPAMLKKVAGVVEMLVEVVGDKPIATLKQSDFVRFTDGIQSIPPHWKVACRKRRISLVDLIALEEGEISKATFEGSYMAVLRPFIEWCQTHRQDQGWPMTITLSGVKYVGSRKEPEAGQRAMLPHELARLFEGAEMKAFSADASEAHKFWLPHVALFTGARMNELCQVNPQVDVRQDESGLWFLDLNQKTPGHAKIKKSVKTAGSSRQVPIHSQLIKLGFLEYVRRVKSQGHTLLFPGFPPSVGRAAPKAGDWFRGLLVDLELRDDTPGARLVGLHAFRSTFLRQAMLLDIENMEVITGHSSELGKEDQESTRKRQKEVSDIVENYQGKRPIQHLSEMLEQLSYPGLNFHTPVLTGA
ncbi:site-specific integrase [Achromobacter animicus]|uniref:site-specific integrase n=1 Tax=Achromobacter animicus TaxID=1389935 RepID=UPI0028AD5FCA|nr:site-specific integrase [Achromobacter animicus]